MSTAQQTLVLTREQIKVRKDFNPRTSIEKDALADLAQSIKSRGILNPILVRPQNGHYLLVGGHRRVAASDLAGVTTFPAVVRDEKTELEDAVADNFNREDLNPLDEAVAFKRLVDKGLTAKGIAEQVGVAQRRVTERLRILDTPKKLHEHYATGALSAQSAKPLAELAEFDAKVAELTGLAAVEGSNRHQFNLNSDAVGAACWVVKYGPGRKGNLVAVELGNYYGSGIDPKILGKLPDDVQAKVDRLEKAAGYGGYKIKLDQPDVDALNAAGVLLAEKKDDGYGRNAIVKDKALLRQVCLDLIDRDTAKLIKQEAQQARERKPSDGAAAAKADERAKEYQERIDSRGFNLRLGDSLLKGLASVELTMDAAKFLCLQALGGNDYGTSNSKASTLAARGLRYVLPGWQHEKEQKNGKVKITYASPRNHFAVGSKDAKDKEPYECSLDSLFWEWWNLAATPQEVLGRTIIAFAAAQYALDTAVPQSQRFGSPPFGQHHYYSPSEVDKIGKKALEALVSKKVPAKTPARTKPATGVTANRTTAAAKKPAARKPAAAKPKAAVKA